MELVFDRLNRDFYGEPTHAHTERSLSFDCGFGCFYEKCIILRCTAAMMRNPARLQF